MGVELEKPNITKEAMEYNFTKYDICRALLPVLKMTRALCDLEDLEYHVDTEEVHAVFKGGYTKKINVACDSGLAMIKDIVNIIEL